MESEHFRSFLYDCIFVHALYGQGLLLDHKKTISLNKLQSTNNRDFFALTEGSCSRQSRLYCGNIKLYSFPVRLDFVLNTREVTSLFN